MAIIGTLGALGTIAPFSIDLYLPALPTLGSDLGASQQQVAATVTMFLARPGVRAVAGRRSERHPRATRAAAGRPAALHAGQPRLRARTQRAGADGRPVPAGPGRGGRDGYLERVRDRLRARTRSGPSAEPPGHDRRRRSRHRAADRRPAAARDLVAGAVLRAHRHRARAVRRRPRRAAREPAARAALRRRRPGPAPEPRHDLPRPGLPRPRTHRRVQLRRVLRLPGRLVVRLPGRVRRVAGGVQRAVRDQRGGHARGRTSSTTGCSPDTRRSDCWPAPWS